LLERRPGWGGGKANALTLSLPPLEDGETARLLSSLLETPVIVAETQAELLARAAGNPLYAEQYARMLAERGTAEQLPESVQGIIAARLDLLSETDKALLQDASVVGSWGWSARSWSSGPGARRLRARSSTRSGICSCARSPTARSRAPLAPASTLPQLPGSRGLAARMTTRRCSPPTT
jgi:hypothetical protein